jgi:hypothetical protein
MLNNSAMFGTLQGFESPAWLKQFNGHDYEKSNFWTCYNSSGSHRSSAFYRHQRTDYPNNPNDYISGVQHYGLSIEQHQNQIVMKKIFLTIVFALVLSLASGAQEKTRKVVTDSVTFMPAEVQIFEGVTKNGNPKWWIELPTESGKPVKVALTESHVTSGRLLALIERQDQETGKYSYSVKFAEPKAKASGKANLSGLK